MVFQSDPDIFLILLLGSRSWKDSLRAFSPGTIRNTRCPLELPVEKLEIAEKKSAP
jgi:hypothetical protein